MMVEVLKRGEPPGKRTYETTCSSCSSELRFKAHEAEFIADQRDGDTLKIICPVCKRPVYVDAHQ
jgi:hypothetical protein